MEWTVPIGKKSYSMPENDKWVFGHFRRTCDVRRGFGAIVVTS